MSAYVNTILIDFGKLKGNELVTQNEDGGYTILINSRLSSRGQMDAYRHAMRHIENRDFEKHDVQEIEADAHRRE